MPRTAFHFEEDTGGTAARLEALRGWVEVGARIAGIALLLIGLGVIVAVIAQTWALYLEPERIAPFVDAIERGSHIDAVLRAEPESAPADAGSPPFRLAYFASWIIVILLLMLLGQLAIAAIRAGAELALFDAKVQRLLRRLARRRQMPVK